MKSSESVELLGKAFAVCCSVETAIQAPAAHRYLELVQRQVKGIPDCEDAIKRLRGMVYGKTVTGLQAAGDQPATLP